MATLTHNFDHLFGKIPASIKGIDTRIQRAFFATPNRIDEYMEQPLLANYKSMFDKTKSNYSQYEAARAVASMYYTDPATFDAIMKNTMKATQPNRDKRPFELVLDFEESGNSEKILDDLNRVFVAKGNRIYKRAKTFIRNTLMEGQTFYRAIVQGDEIVELRKIKGPRSGFQIYGPILHRDGRNYFVQKEVSSDKVVNVFFDWEVIPFYWNYDDEVGAGMPLGCVSRQAGNFEQKGATALKTARLTRAWPKKYYHYENMPVAQFQELVAMHKKQKQALSMEDELVTDEHTMSTPQSLDLTSNALFQIDDIKYHQTEKMRGLLLPRAFYSGEGERYPNRAVMDVYYDEWVTSTVAAVEEMATGDYEDSGILKFVDLQLTLKGMRWWNTPVTLEWASKHRMDGDENTSLDKSFDAGILSPQTYLSYKHNLDAEAELERILEFREMRKSILGDDEFTALTGDRQRSPEKLTNDEGEEDVEDE